jgi:hypothetical protein
MNSLRTLLTASALALVAVSAAQAGEAVSPGSYKLSIGAGAVCPITLSADGSASYASDCAQSANIAKWQAKFNGVELKTASGETVALLKGKDGSYSGTRFADGRAMALSADGSSLASSH